MANYRIEFWFLALGIDHCESVLFKTLPMVDVKFWTFSDISISFKMVAYIICEAEASSPNLKPEELQISISLLI